MKRLLILLIILFSLNCVFANNDFHVASIENPIEFDIPEIVDDSHYDGYDIDYILKRDRFRYVNLDDPERNEYDLLSHKSAMENDLKHILSDQLDFEDFLNDTNYYETIDNLNIKISNKSDYLGDFYRQIWSLERLWEDEFIDNNNKTLLDEISLNISILDAQLSDLDDELDDLRDDRDDLQYDFNRYYANHELYQLQVDLLNYYINNSLNTSINYNVDLKKEIINYFKEDIENKLDRINDGINDYLVYSVQEKHRLDRIQSEYLDLQLEIAEESNQTELSFLELEAFELKFDFLEMEYGISNFLQRIQNMNHSMLMNRYLLDSYNLDSTSSFDEYNILSFTEHEIKREELTINYLEKIKLSLIDQITNLDESNKTYSVFIEDFSQLINESNYNLNFLKNYTLEFNESIQINGTEDQREDYVDLVDDLKYFESLNSSVHAYVKSSKKFVNGLERDIGYINHQLEDIDLEIGFRNARIELLKEELNNYNSNFYSYVIKNDSLIVNYNFSDAFDVEKLDFYVNGDFVKGDSDLSGSSKLIELEYGESYTILVKAYLDAYSYFEQEFDVLSLSQILEPTIIENLTVSFKDDINSVSGLEVSKDGNKINFAFKIENNIIKVKLLSRLHTGDKVSIKITSAVDEENRMLVNPIIFDYIVPEKDMDGDGVSDSIEQADISMDTDGDGIINLFDRVVGNNVVTNVDSSIIINGESNFNGNLTGRKNVRFILENASVHFDFDFNNTLDLSEVIVLKEELDGESAILINGLNVEYKNVTLPITSQNSKDVCIIDAEVGELKFTSDCSGTNEVHLICDGSIQSNYSCSRVKDNLIITGLKHSAVKTQCSEDWSYSDWSTCVLDSQSRTAVDKNNCGTEFTKQELTRSCTPYEYTKSSGRSRSRSKFYTRSVEPAPKDKTCVEDWKCTSWSVCDSGEQTRYCYDSNHCGTETNKPQMVMSCGVVSFTPQIDLDFDDGVMERVNKLEQKKQLETVADKTDGWTIVLTGIIGILILFILAIFLV